MEPITTQEEFWQSATSQLASIDGNVAAAEFDQQVMTIAVVFIAAIKAFELVLSAMRSTKFFGSVALCLAMLPALASADFPPRFAGFDIHMDGSWELYIWNGPGTPDTYAAMDYDNSLGDVILGRQVILQHNSDGNHAFYYDYDNGTSSWQLLGTEYNAQILAAYATVVYASAATFADDYPTLLSSLDSFGAAQNASGGTIVWQGQTWVLDGVSCSPGGLMSVGGQTISVHEIVSGYAQWAASFTCQGGVWSQVGGSTAFGQLLWGSFADSGCACGGPGGGGGGGDPCDPYDEGLVGTNCCGGDLFGATYYVCDVGGCPTLCCNSSACHGCPENPGLPTEGIPCECPDGSNGTVSWTYDENGCPNGTICDECQPCECQQFCDLEGGDGCTCTDGKRGHIETTTDGEGCPLNVCQCEDECPDCTGPLCDLEEGDGCTCTNGNRGHLHITTDSDGCEVRTCECEDAECEVDADGDGCCDDEDPDPTDPSANCTDCNSLFAGHFASLVGTFRSHIGVTDSPVTNSSWSFSIDTTRVNMETVRNFPMAASLDFTDGTWTGVSDEAGEWLSEIMSWRETVRSLIGLGIWFSFSCMLLGIFLS